MNYLRPFFCPSVSLLMRDLLLSKLSALPHHHHHHHFCLDHSHHSPVRDSDRLAEGMVKEESLLSRAHVLYFGQASWRWCFRPGGFSVLSLSLLVADEPRVFLFARCEASDAN